MRMGNHKVLRTPDANLWRYSMYDLIDAVHKNALIWDREHSNFHNRELRQEAWHEVARLVYENFDDALEKDKDEIIKTLQKRWKNTRDSFLRNWRLKLSATDSSRAAYIYDKEMAFLLKCKEEQGASANEADNEQTLIAPAAAAAGTTKRVKKVANKRRQQPKRKAPGAPSLASDRDKKRFKRERRSSSSSQSEIEQVPVEQGAANGGGGAAAAHIDDDSAWETEATSFEMPSKQGAEQSTKATTDIPSSSSGVAATVAVANTGAATVPAPMKMKQDVVSEGSSSAVATSVPSSSGTGGVIEHDADQAFFDSIKPHLLKMTSDQKLDFQIDVLKLLRNYRN